MPPEIDPVKVEDTKEWLKKAYEDLRASKHSLNANPPLTSTSAFHSQQAIEKSLKAFLAWNDVQFRKTHSIEEIGEQCLKLDVSLKFIIDTAVPLSSYAWSSRYPGGIEDPTLDEANEALDIADKVYQEILNRIPTNAHP